MTTIAVKNGVMAFDSKITEDGGHVGYMNKGRKTSKFLVATCGSVEDGEAFMDWLAAGGVAADKKLFGLDRNLDDFLAIAINKTGKVFRYEGRLYPFVMEAPFFALGSGAPYAMGAMAFGASAAQAVKIASKFDLATGGTVRELKWSKK